MGGESQAPRAVLSDGGSFPRTPSSTPPLSQELRASATVAACGRRVHGYCHVLSRPALPPTRRAVAVVGAWNGPDASGMNDRPGHRCRHGLARMGKPLKSAESAIRTSRASQRRCDDASLQHKSTSNARPPFRAVARDP